MKVNILGVPYTIQYKSPVEDKFLRECDKSSNSSCYKFLICEPKFAFLIDKFVFCLYN